MASLFGTRWSSQFGPAVDAVGGLTATARTWASGLSGVSGERLAAGLRLVCEAGGEWPPTLPQFRAACVASASAADRGHGSGRGAYAVFPAVPALPDPRTPEQRRVDRLARTAAARRDLRAALASLSLDGRQLESKASCGGDGAAADGEVHSVADAGHAARPLAAVDQVSAQVFTQRKPGFPELAEGASNGAASGVGVGVGTEHPPTPPAKLSPVAPHPLPGAVSKMEGYAHGVLQKGAEG